MSIMSGIMQGGGGIAVTQLDADISAAAVTISVDDVSGYLDSDIITIRNEDIYYTGRDTGLNNFTGCTRGYDGLRDTEASAHSSGDKVYTSDAHMVNSALGFNLQATAIETGMWSTVVIPWNFLVITLPNLVVLNFVFLSGKLAIIGVIWYAMAVGLIVTLAIAIANALPWWAGG